MAMLIRLEDFEASTEPGAATDVAAIEAQPGYDAGFAAGQAAAAAERDNLSAQFIQTLTETSFGFAEARQHTLQSLSPLFRALMDQLLPAVVDDAFKAKLIEALHALAQARVTGPVRLIVHPDQAAAAADILPEIQGISFELHQDPAVGPHGALISHPTAETALDLDDLIAQIRSILSAFFDKKTPPTQETSTHG